jgi:uncharacterized repeat protein (TIGR01451 family)
LVDRIGETITPTVYAEPAGVDDVNKGPFASGVNNIVNTANVTANGGININSNQTSIQLDAAPDLVVTMTEGGANVEPGSVVTYAVGYSNATAINGQDAVNVVLTETVPANTTFNLGASTAGWGGPGCVDGAPAGTTCTFIVAGQVAAGAPPVNVAFAVSVLAALPAGAASVSNTSSIADDGSNGALRNTADDSAGDTTLIVGNWNGDAGTDWNNPANWSNNLAPGNNVSIPNVTNAPAISTSVTHSNFVLNGENLTINGGATLTVNGTAALGGNVVDGAGTLELGSIAAISRTTGQVNATLLKTFLSTGAFTFPVGTTGAYSPVVVNVTSGTGPLSIKANTGTVAPLNPAMTLQRFWTLNGSGITADVTFNYLDADVAGNENNYRTIRVAGGSPTAFANSPTCPTTNGSACVNATANTIFVAGLASFSDWTAGELAPTAAPSSVAGRVVDAYGRAISGALISIIDPTTGLQLSARTNTFGYFRFQVPSGMTYVLSVAHRRYVFEQPTQVVQVFDNVTGLTFVGSRP